jgi:hypothetical protein
MTLFFVNKRYKLGGPRMIANPQILVSLSDVIVIVGRNDQWVTTRDRHDAHGRVVHPQRRAELLETYQTVIRPTNFLQDD